MQLSQNVLEIGRPTGNRFFQRPEGLADCSREIGDQLRANPTAARSASKPLRFGLLATKGKRSNAAATAWNKAATVPEVAGRPAVI